MQAEHLFSDLLIEKWAVKSDYPLEVDAEVDGFKRQN